MLSAQQSKMLHRSILNSLGFRGFEQLVRHGIGVPIERLVRRGEESAMVFEVIQAAERAGWTTELVRSLYGARPDLPELAEIYESLGLASEVAFQHSGIPTGTVLRSTELGTGTLSGEGFLSVGADVGAWRKRLAEIEACVCRVEVGASILATGFLIRPDLVLTCHHVIREAIGQRGTKVRFRFDYRAVARSADGAGVVVTARDTEWLVDHSPYPAFETESSGDNLPREDELDFALIHLAHPIGAEPVEAGTQAGAPRGWLPITETPPPFAVGMPMVIAQYADGGPIRVEMDTNAVLGLNANGTRVLYTTATAPGSAGAPCFNKRLELVGMHQGKTHSPGGLVSGQGIPIVAIRSALLRHGIREAFELDEATARKPSKRLMDESALSPPEPGPIIHPDDPQRERWGGRAERNGRRLGVRLNDPGNDTFFVFDASVESVDGTQLDGPIVFHLHDTYPRPNIWIRKFRDNNQRAFLNRISAYGVYTIGAQVKDATGQWVGLEFDLSAIENLPISYLNK